MQKVIDFLERYCQWVAVGIGALFFLLALYQYLPVVRTPVTATLGSEVVTPGEIDPTIVQNVADPLEAAMSDNSTVAIKVPSYAQQVAERVTSVPKLAPLSSAMTVVNKVELPELPWDAKESQQVGPQQIALPSLPAAILDPAPTSGFAQVTPVTAGTSGNPPTPVAGQTRDVTWVRVPFSVSISQIDREFRSANIPGALANTNFVRVQLVRQRQLPDDSWAPEEVLAPIETAGIQPFPAGNNVGAFLQFNQWAIAHQQQIVQPPFYQFVAGDNPMAAPAPVPTEGEGQDGQAAAFDPETFPPTASLEGLTPEQRKAVQAVRQRRAKEAQDQRRQNQGGNRGGPPGGRGPGGPGGRGGGGPGGISDFGTDRGTITTLLQFVSPSSHEGSTTGIRHPAIDRGSITTLQFAPPPPGGYPPGGGYPGGGYPPGYPGGGYPGGEGGQPMGTPGEITLPPIPNQQFIPVSGTPDVLGHAFDMTAKPGAVYRYRIRYTLMNPLFNANAAGVGPQLAAAYEIVGENKSAWTEPVTVKSNIHVYLQATPASGANAVRFTLFRWQNGKWNRANQTFSPGDSIGKLDGEIDYRSNYTLVDSRKDSTTDRAYAMLMADDGTIEKRDAETDSNSEEFKELTLAVDGPPVPTAPPGGMPGGYPGGGYPGGGYPGGGYPPGGPGGARP